MIPFVCCNSPELAALSNAELLQRIREEINAAELVHSFPSNELNPYTAEFVVDDGNLTVMEQNDFLPNPRTVYFAGLHTVDLSFEDYGRYRLENLAETALLGFPPFTSSKQTKYGHIEVFHGRVI